MKIKFKKATDNEISIVQVVDNKESHFSYVDMIKDLINKVKIEDPVIDGSFSDPEIASINSMVKFINSELESEQPETNAAT